MSLTESEWELQQWEAQLGEDGLHPEERREWRPGMRVDGAVCVGCGRETHTFEQLRECMVSIT